MIRLPPILCAAVASCASLIFIGQSQCDAFTSPSSPSPSLKGTAKISPILSSSGRLRSANSIENVRKSSSNLHLFDSLLQPKKTQRWLIRQNQGYTKNAAIEIEQNSRRRAEENE
mmetsp:Transcript_25529/g.49025  ORF Transcript_25529/g.49025 Transcript_25529/m.49025 type:complete len:115 (+) Transcript_25529:188-532(+)